MKRKRIARMAAMGLVSALLIGGVLPIGVVADPEPASRVEEMLENLSDVLGRLESELAALQAPAAERLEEGLEQMTELIGELLRELAQPQRDADGGGPRPRILKLDLMLHRLVHILDEIVKNADTPARPEARDAVDGLRRWIAGYIDGMTAGMEPRVADRFEKAVREMVHDLGARVAQMAERAAPDDRHRPILARLVERLEDLLSQLDAFVLHSDPKPAAAPERP